MRLIALSIVVLLLAGCARNQPYSETDRYLGTRRHVSETIVQQQFPGVKSMATALMVTNGGREIWGIRLNVVREDLNYPKITSVWADGQKLPYQKLDRNRLGDLRQEVGQIILGPGDFARFARSGTAFKAIGKRGSYLFEVPARLFQQVIALARSPDS